MRIFCTKILTFFQQKYQRICNIYILNINVTLTNDVFNFEQLTPGCDFDLNAIGWNILSSMKVMFYDVNFPNCYGEPRLQRDNTHRKK